MIEEKLYELEKRVEHLHSTFNDETDSIEEDVETLSNSIDILVDAMNKIASAVTEIQSVMFVNDEDHVSLTSPACVFATKNEEEIHKSYI